tara:strand:+ start:320 stop:685 length:366 start_codon:yes stop_codon:yes gene_type:complete
MSHYNWCHNPDCHTIKTQSRIRGTGNNKVLRTIKIKVGRYNYNNDDSPSIWDYFCNNNCLFSFLGKFAREVANLNPTTKPKETPIKVEKTKYDTHKYRWVDNGYERYETVGTRTHIEVNEE